MKNKEVVALMEASLKAMETRLMNSMEDRLKEHSEHRSATSEPSRKAKRKRITSSLSAIPSDMREGLEFENLPREIVAEIMSRVPTESLMRFKCLNKSLYFLIRCLVSDSEFVAKHQSRAEAHPDVLLFNEPPPCRRSRDEDWTAVWPLRRHRIFSKLMTDFVETAGEEGEIRCVTKDIDVSHLPSSLVRQRTDNNLEVYHCNGVAFLTKTRRALTIYNLVTNAVSTFEPKSDIKVNRKSEILAMGFGSDSGVKSFKFVRILSSMKAQVYNPSNSGNSWREIKFSVCKNKLSHVIRHVCVRGYIFWLFENPRLCLCFDVTEESFQIVVLPNETKANECKTMSLAAREGSLCLFSCYYKGPRVDVWVMDIGDESFSWRKWMRIECLPFPFSSLVTFWRSDKLLISSARNTVMSYDIHTKEYKKLIMNGVLGKIHYLGPYVNSLASVKWMHDQTCSITTNNEQR